MAEPIVTHIADTARWVAAYRAMESERPDALFRDPLAAGLAGERGRAIASSLPKMLRRNVWPIIMRTKAIDDLTMEAVSRGADRVLNLAAGLDTRPYRLPLPSSLSWVEADLASMVDEKERALSQEQPRCLLRRERVDLADPAQRSAFLDRALDGSREATVLTEGLLIYLPDDRVRLLALDLASRPAVRTWIVDLVSPAVLRMMRRQLGGRFSADAEMRFAPADGPGFFATLGWKVTQMRSFFRDALRARRLPRLLRPLGILPDADPSHPGKRPWNGVVALERIGLGPSQ